MCGTVKIQANNGMAQFSDIKIKRTGQHVLKVFLSDFSILPYDHMPSEYMEIQKQILATLLLVESEAFYTVSRFEVKASDPYYLMSDFKPMLRYLTSNTTRAGSLFDPAPACIVTDFYGNLAPARKFRIGLTIRDSDQDEFDPDLAKKKFADAPWPRGALNSEMIGDYVDVLFSRSAFEEDSTKDDRDGCPPLGKPAQGCPDLSEDVFSLIGRDAVTTPKWCPATAERRYCRSCMTAERFFSSFNETFWKQEYEFADSNAVSGLQQLRGGFDCPLRKHCSGNEDGVGCGCLIPLRNASMRLWIFAQHALPVEWMTAFPLHGQRMDGLSFQRFCVLSPEWDIVCAALLPPDTREILLGGINPDCGKLNGT